MAGRKTKLTPQVQDLIVQALNVGAHYEHAAQYAGITERTFYNWMAKGEAGTPPYVQFFQAVKKSESQAGVGYLALIDSAARAGNWQAAAWKLERRWPKLYGRRVLEVSGPGGGPIPMTVIQGDLGSGDSNGHSVQIPDVAPGTNGAVYEHEAL